MTRRLFLALALRPSPCRYVALEVDAASSGRTGPGWPVFELPPREWVALRIPRQHPKGPAQLRLALASTERGRWRIEVRSAKSRASLGTIEMWTAYSLQPHSLALRRAEHLEIRAVEVAKPVAMVKAAPEAPAIAPHLMYAGTLPPLDEFHLRMASLDCLTDFTWTEGCVMDGLLALKLDAALRRHVDIFFNRTPRVQVRGIESTLPYGVLARIQPTHAAIDDAIAFWKCARDPQGCIQDGTMTSAEGSYTVAYPLAAVAVGRHDPESGREALRQLQFRIDRLPQGDALNLRWDVSIGFTFRNWCRGVCWYLLGIARTLELLGPAAAVSIREEWRARAEWIARRQLPSGLWSTFVDDPAIAPDTAGSAGIAAALAIGVRLGVLPAAMQDVARRTLRGCIASLTPDGLLAGGSQSNSGGEVLQRSTYRVIHQFGMGLLAQLLAELEKKSS